MRMHVDKHRTVGVKEAEPAGTAGDRAARCSRAQPHSHESRREADATLPTSAEAKAALLYVYSHANTGSPLSKLGSWIM